MLVCDKYISIASANTLLPTTSNFLKFLDNRTQIMAFIYNERSRLERLVGCLSLIEFMPVINTVYAFTWPDINPSVE